MPLLISDGRVLRGAGPSLERADVLIDAGRIVAVGPSVAGPPGAETIDAAAFLVIPGLVNARTHAHVLFHRTVTARRGSRGSTATGGAPRRRGT